MRDGRLDILRDALLEARDDVALPLIAEIAGDKRDEPLAMITNADGSTVVTEAVATMYDAIVGSLDWGSEFMSVEEIEAIVQIGKLMGFASPPGWEQQLEAARRYEEQRAERERADPVRYPPMRKRGSR